MNEFYVDGGSIGRSRAFCLILPFFFWFILTIAAQNPNFFSFLGDRENFADLGLKYVELITSGLAPVVNALTKPMEATVTNVASFAGGARDFMSVFLVLLFPMVFITLVSIFMSSFYSMRACWIVMWGNLIVLLAVAIPMLYLKGDHLDERFEMDMVFFYALAVLFMIAFTLLMLILGNALFRRWFKKEAVTFEL